MSKIICSAAIRGAHKIVDRAEEKYQEALTKWGAEQEIGFPNTAYYLPIIYGMIGISVQKLKDVDQVLKRCRSLLPDMVADHVWLPYLAPALEAGMATLFAEEIIEAIRLHNQQAHPGEQRSTRFQHLLTAGETITGLIVATALVYPDNRFDVQQ